jgi:hypothetical protein
MKAGRILPMVIFILVLAIAWLTFRRSSGYLQGASWQTLDATDCYNARYDVGYQGIKTDAQAQAACDANPRCKGAARHAGGDWWLLSEVSTRKKAPIGNKCIIKPVSQTPPPPPVALPPPPPVALPPPPSKPYWNIMPTSRLGMPGFGWRASEGIGCYNNNPSSDIGRLGVQDFEQAKATCAANPMCRGAQRNNTTGEWMMLSDASTWAWWDQGSSCIIKT